MQTMKTKTPYKTPEIKAILLEAEDVLAQSGPGGFFGDDDSFIQNRMIKVFE